MPIPVDHEITLARLFRTATDHEAAAIREAAIRAGLLHHCRCGWDNPAGAERCEACRTRVLPGSALATVPALGLIAVRDYLTEAYGEADGTARFVRHCRAGLCGGIVVEVTDEVIAEAEQHRYSNSWPVIAEEILAGVEADALDSGALRIAAATN